MLSNYFPPLLIKLILNLHYNLANFSMRDSNGIQKDEAERPGSQNEEEAKQKFKPKSLFSQ